MLVLRSAAFNIFLYLFTAICSVVAMIAAIVWPAQLPSVARQWSRGWLYCYRLICGVSFRVEGSENVPAGACIIAMKHQSTWDTFALFAIFKRPIFVLKSELMWIPIFGWMLKRLGCISVKRGTGKLALDSMVQGAKTACARGNQIVIFPEGTRSAVGSRSEYKSGVSHLYKILRVACVPVALNSGVLWPRRTFMRQPGLITVDIRPAIPPGLPRRQMFDRMVSEIEIAAQRLTAK